MTEHTDPFSPGDEGYRTCTQPVTDGVCGRDCEPEPLTTDEGIRISFACPVHGVHSVVDPFEDRR